MKVVPTSDNKIGIYIWLLARNLLSSRRSLRKMKKMGANNSIIEFHKGIQLESHNRYYSAIEYFQEEIKK